jgi:hypothetical protein
MSDKNVGVASAWPGEWLRLRGARTTAVALICSWAIALAGCGGGVEVQGDGFSVGVTIDGQPYGGAVESGRQRDVAFYAGQSVSFEASESVRWTLYAGNVAIPADGSTVFYGGASIRATTVSSSRIVVDTASSGPLSPPVQFTLTATSTWDSTLVTTINVYLY